MPGPNACCLAREVLHLLQLLQSHDHNSPSAAGVPMSLDCCCVCQLCGPLALSPSMPHYKYPPRDVTATTPPSGFLEMSNYLPADILIPSNSLLTCSSFLSSADFPKAVCRSFRAAYRSSLSHVCRYSGYSQPSTAILMGCRHLPQPRQIESMVLSRRHSMRSAPLDPFTKCPLCGNPAGGHGSGLAM